MLLSHSGADATRLRLFPTYFLLRLVMRHHEACIEQGLDLRALADGDDSAVLRWIEERTSLLPALLAEALERIDMLTDERGAAALLKVGAAAGIDLRALGRDPLQVAAGAFLDYRPVFEQAHGQRLVETLRGVTEFLGRGPAAVPIVDIPALRALETYFEHRFGAHRRGAYCRVSLGHDAGRLIFTVAHGSLFRFDEALHDEPFVADASTSAVPAAERAPTLSERAVRYRPQRRDIVVYDARAGNLRIRAGDATLHAYRRGFGEFLYRDADWFSGVPVIRRELFARRRWSGQNPGPVSVTPELSTRSSGPTYTGCWSFRPERRSARVT